MHCSHDVHPGLKHGPRSFTRVPVSHECLETRPKESKHVCRFFGSLTRLEPTAIGGELSIACEGTGVSTGGRAHSSSLFVVQTKESTTCVEVVFMMMLGPVHDGQPTMILLASFRKRQAKSRLVLKDFNGNHGRAQPEMFVPTPSTLSLKTLLAVSSHDRNNHPECDHITVANDVDTAFLHGDVDQELFAEPREAHECYESELREDEVWQLNKALYRYRKAPKLWHQHFVSLLESLNYHSLLTDPSCFRKL